MSDNKYKYDFIIVGAGFAGASCARLLTDKGYKCLIIEERPFVSGNCVTDKRNDIDVHFFGAHIIHTNNESVWNFLNTYGKIREWRYNFRAWVGGQTFKIPFGLDILQSLYGTIWPYEADKELKNEEFDNINNNPKTIKDYVIKNFGKKYYDSVIDKFYSKLYGGVTCDKLPKECLLEKRIDDIILYNDSFYPEIYQGVPENGYVELVENMIGNDIDIILNTNFLSNKEKYLSLGKYCIYTGELDKFFNYCMGPLDWISATFEFRDESEKTTNLSGSPVIHFCDDNTEWYRMTEHKWLTPWKSLESEEFNTHTFLTYEYFKKWENGDEVFYPLYNEKSLGLYKRYINKLHQQYPNIILCGRKAKYTNQHICDVIEDAIKISEKFPDKS